MKDLQNVRPGGVGGYIITFGFVEPALGEMHFWGLAKRTWLCGAAYFEGLRGLTKELQNAVLGGWKNAFGFAGPLKSGFGGCKTGFGFVGSLNLRALGDG